MSDCTEHFQEQIATLEGDVGTLFYMTYRNGGATLDLRRIAYEKGQAITLNVGPFLRMANSTPIFDELVE